MTAVLSISADVPSSKNEGDSGTTVFTFTVNRSVETVGTTTVDFTVTGNTGLDRLDFVGGVLPTGQVSFADGETDKTISIEVAGDFLIESNEVFTVRLSNPSGGATFGTESAIGTIQADDTPTANPQFSEATASAPFGLSSAGKYAARFSSTSMGTRSRRIRRRATDGVQRPGLPELLREHRRCDVAGVQAFRP